MKSELISKALSLGIIGFNFGNPIRFKSGIMSPIYCDWRKSSEYPDLMNLISELFYEKFCHNEFDVIMGVAAGAVPHSERFANKLNLPSAYVRPGSKTKDHGLKKLIEGSSVSDKTVLLIEDLFSTGGSALENYIIVKIAGAKKIKLCSIFSYDFKELYEEFEKERLQPDSLITIHDILPEVEKILPKNHYDSLLGWVKDPKSWFNSQKLTFDYGYLTTLRQSAHTYSSIVCMGIDPIAEAIPIGYSRNGIEGIQNFIVDLFNEMNSRKIFPGAIKPNEGFYTLFNQNIGNNSEGSAILNNVIHDLSSIVDLPVINDPKRGDIGKSSANYAKQYLGGVHQPFDAITVHPWMGTDSIMPFAEYCNNKNAKGVYVLNKTSNSGAKDFQMLKLADGRYMYEVVSEKILEWAKEHPGVGAVVGGETIEVLKPILAFFAGKNIPVLVPGVGAQGGSAKDVVNTAREVGFELDLLRINSSSGLTHPWYKKPGDVIPSSNEAIEMCIQALRTMNEEINFSNEIG